MKILLLIATIAIIYGCGKPDKSSLSYDAYLAYQKGDSLFRQDSNSAFYYFNEAAIKSEDRLLKANAYNRMATMLFNAGDFFDCQEAVMKSQKLLDEKNPTDSGYLLSNYNLLGRSYFEQKTYDSAIVFFQKAAKFQGKRKLNPMLINNLAVAYQKNEDYPKAKSLLQFVIDHSKQDTDLYAMALSNMARTKWLENPSYYAVPELLLALKLREMKFSRLGQSASFSHLADYYFDSRPDSSLFFANKLYHVAQSPDTKLDAIEKLTMVSPSKNTKDYLSIYYKLNDSLIQARNSSRNQFAVVRYAAERTEAENQRLRRRYFKQNIYLYSILAGSMMLLVLGLVLYRRRKRRIEQDSQQRVRDHQLKTSKKVHDVVANGLYGIMTDLEHRDEIDREPLLDKIELLYEQSRDISYDQPLRELGDYSTQIHRLLSAFRTADTKILIAGNHEMIWTRLAAHEKKELEYVLQEFMVNMSKHSRAQNVVIKFSEETDRLNIHYKDDGIGLSSAFKAGNGLRNTETRIKNLGGTIIFDGMTGMKIEISLPTGKANV